MDYINPLDFIKPQVLPAVVIGQIKTDCLMVKTCKFSERSVFSNHITSIDDRGMLVGFGFYLVENLPRKAYNIVSILHDLGFDAGFNITCDGFVTHAIEE